jgi:phospholipid-translocating ATPase
MEIVDRNGEVYQFDIMLIFPFTSESKRMGIIVKERKSKQLVLYLKGADIVIQSKISSLDSDFMK